MKSDFIQTLGLVSGVSLPLFNIPLIARLLKRKSADDLSLSWAVGVWVCIVGMTPQALRSQDVAFRAYGIFNVTFFTVVAFLVVKYRFGRGRRGRT